MSVDERLAVIEETLDRTIGILEELVRTMTKITDLIEKLSERT